MSLTGAGRSTSLSHMFFDIGRLGWRAASHAVQAERPERCAMAYRIQVVDADGNAVSTTDLRRRYNETQTEVKAKAERIKTLQADLNTLTSDRDDLYREQVSLHAALSAAGSAPKVKPSKGITRTKRKTRKTK